jgi:hypothetical protein
MISLIDVEFLVTPVVVITMFPHVWQSTHSTTKVAPPEMVDVMPVPNEVDDVDPQVLNNRLSVKFPF